MIETTWVSAALALIVIVLILAVALLWRRTRDGVQEEAALAARMDGFERAQERTERELRDAIAQSGAAQRAELAQLLGGFQQGLAAQVTTSATQQAQQIDLFGQRIRDLADANERRLGEIRTTLEGRLRELQADNALKLDQMRQTVDEKLHATLEQRLGESFKLVSDRLEAVQRGLGEMHALAQGVGDLKRVLSNVKTRGTFGEVQLGALLENVLTPEQYERNVITRPGSRDVVEFAIRLPGAGGELPHVWLPIDAKFPSEDYERLMVAQEAADPAAVEGAAKALEARIRLEAKSIADKYLSPPHTTDFAILFLPTEGLYAEVLRRPGVFDDLQRKFKVTVAGPTTLSAMLNALQMGFRTLAIEKRSGEVWDLLGAVKTEFGKFGDVLASTKKSLETALNKMGDAEVRTRAIERKLRNVQELPTTAASQLLDE